MSRQLNIERISFVAHSLGGLVVRKAVETLLDRTMYPMGHIMPRLHKLVTLGTPHLALLQLDSTVVTSLLHGARMHQVYFKRRTTPNVIDQLAMTDHAIITETFLYVLSQSKALA